MSSSRLDASETDRFLLYLEKCGYEISFRFVDSGITLTGPADPDETGDILKYYLMKGNDTIGELRSRGFRDPPKELVPARNDEAFDQAVKDIEAYKGSGEAVDGKSLARLRLLEGLADIDAGGKTHQRHAVARCREALKLDPTLARAWNAMGVWLAKLGREEEAIECYHKAVEVDPAFIRAWYNLGNRYSGLDEKQRSLEAYRKASELDPIVPGDWEFKARALEKLGEYNAALEYVKEVLRSNPTNAAADAMLKRIKAQIAFDEGFDAALNGDFEEAIGHFDRVISLNPKNDHAWNNKGYCLAKLKMHKKGLECAEEAIGLNPQNTGALDTKAECLVALSRYDEGIETYSELLKRRESAKPEDRERAMEEIIRLRREHAHSTSPVECFFCGGRGKTLNEAGRFRVEETARLNQISADTDFAAIHDPDDYDDCSVCNGTGII